MSNDYKNYLLRKISQEFPSDKEARSWYKKQYGRRMTNDSVTCLEVALEYLTKTEAV